uniref:Uncharacterized protein n=1 Tax=Plectus sambesii TaxID=2011161 RepID=A0A914VDL5_9BILA
MRPSHCLTISILFALSLKVELKPLPFCAQERTLFIEKVDLKTHLLEMSSLDDRFAVVSSKKIHLHQATENGWKEIRSGVVPKMGKDPIAPIYFELLENNCVIICYDDGCNIGDFSEALTWKEYTFPPELSPATAVSVLYTKAGVLKVQVISSMNSAILIYGKDGKVIAQISDVDATTDLTTVLAFEDVGYAYFLGSVKRAYLPGIIAGRLPKTAPPKSVTRLTRIGNNDGTAELQLPIDLPLACGENKENLEEYIVLAATYDTRKKHIVAVIEKSDANGISKEYKVCLFQLADLQQDFKITLNVCQSTSRELSSQCKYGGEDIDNELSNLHCLIFTCRSGSRPSYTSCSACNNLPPGSGSLTKSNTTSHQYSRLVQFKPFVGVELVRLPSYGHQKPVSITLDGSSAVFVLYDDGLLFR